MSESQAGDRARSSLFESVEYAMRMEIDTIHMRWGDGKRITERIILLLIRELNGIYFTGSGGPAKTYHEKISEFGVPDHS